MASCCSDTSRPRCRGGDISAMYSGESIEATPMPIPAMMRKRINLAIPWDDPQPIADLVKRVAASSNTFRPPKRSQTAPANIAPSTQPTRVELAAQPDHGRSQGEFGLHKTDSPGKDRGIKTEQPSTQRRHQADHGQI